MASVTTGSGTTSPRRQRYNRSSTTSVTQLLSDGYSSFINRLTRRGPSEKSDPIVDTKLSTVRSRFDDKLMTNKNSTLANIRRYENNGHVSPYASLTSVITAPTSRKLNGDRTYSSYLNNSKSRIEASPLRSATSINALNRSDSFRRAHMKDKSSPITKRYPLKEANNNIENTIFLGSTRSRLEDKYSSVLDRIAIQKKERARNEKIDRDKTLEPETSLPRGLMRSLTTAVFGEQSFKRNIYSREKTRDKTPYRNTADRKLSSHKQRDKEEYKNGLEIFQKDRIPYGKDRDSVYRRHQRRSLRAEKSENTERKHGKLSLRPVDINIQSGARDLISPLQGVNETNSKLKITNTPASSPVREIGRQKQIYFPSSDEDDDKTPVGDRVLSERETRRKEIQGLIMKYAHLDEVYGRIGEKDPVEASTVSSVIRKPEPLNVGDVVALPPELRARHRPQRPRHLIRRAATPPVSKQASTS